MVTHGQIDFFMPIRIDTRKTHTHTHIESYFSQTKSGTKKKLKNTHPKDQVEMPVKKINEI